MRCRISPFKDRKASAYASQPTISPSYIGLIARHRHQIRRSFYSDLVSLAAASASEGSAWSQAYGYDRCGNRAVTAGYVPTPALTPSALTAFSTSTNRITNASYDAAGNLITDQAGRTFSYDGENRQLTYNGGLGVVNYYYDGDGRRVKKLEGGDHRVRL